MAKLYELTAGYQNIRDLLYDETIEQSIVCAALSHMSEQIEDKAMSIATILEEMKSDIDAIKSEEDRLSARSAALLNKQRSLKEYLKQNMESLGFSKIKTPIYTISIQNNPPSVQIKDEKLIPIEYLDIVPQTTKPNKTIIANAIKKGNDVPGVELIQGKSLRIR